MLYKILFAFIAFEYLAKVQAADRHFDLQLQNITCYGHPNLLKKLICSFEKLSRNRYDVSVTFELLRQMPSNLDASALLFIRAEKAKKSIKFLDVRVKVCDLLTSVLSIPLAKEIMERVTASSNLPYTCPIKENIMFNITKVPITDDLFPRYTPPIHFNFTMNFNEGKKLYAKFDLTGFRMFKM
ncbi:uncharacterized protein LOC142242996 [Haematobia irritans]|uniref:uncharacterized protein LOC142242996 n=1 Tax=Haematobia irritans TaxID=7368 RepID=UPI003F5051CC